MRTLEITKLIGIELSQRITRTFHQQNRVSRVRVGKICSKSVEQSGRRAQIEGIGRDKNCGNYYDILLNKQDLVHFEWAMTKAPSLFSTSKVISHMLLYAEQKMRGVQLN